MLGSNKLPCFVLVFPPFCCRLMSLTMYLILLLNQLSSSWLTWRSQSQSRIFKLQISCGLSLQMKIALKPCTERGHWWMMMTQLQIKTIGNTKSYWRRALGRKCQSASCPACFSETSLLISTSIPIHSSIKKNSKFFLAALSVSQTAVVRLPLHSTQTAQVKWTALMRFMEMENFCSLIGFCLLPSCRGNAIQWLQSWKQLQWLRAKMRSCYLWQHTCCVVGRCISSDCHKPGKSWARQFSAYVNSSSLQ